MNGIANSLKAAVLGTALLAVPAQAAPGDWIDQIRPIPTPSGVEGVPLAPQSAAAVQEGWAQQTVDQRMIYNVTRPALIPVAGPIADDAARPAVILVPGGGFEFLSIDNEGFNVAAKLSALGVRVFILKYRTLALPGGFDGFHAALGQTFAGRPPARGTPPIDIRQGIAPAAADAQAALRMVRAHAAEWHVDPARVGLLGFSAGAMTTLAMVQANAPDARPDFAGLIYGPTGAGTIPAKAPPLFAAIAMDDRFFGKEDLGLIDGWRKSGASVEFHLYSGGGHGFASHPNGTTSDAWFDQFALWLRAIGIAR